jgi:ADP-ribose pyrophosphatase YjhB (NUDIX family)
MNRSEHSDRLLVAVDCIIFGFADRQLQTLLVRRPVKPQKGMFSLMGGLVYKSESLDEAANRVLKELTGLDDVFLEHHKSYGQVDRDSRERTVSISYYALLRQSEVNAQLKDEYQPSWHPISDLPPLAFDHEEMVAAALERLRYQATHEPVVFNVLPEKFTLIDLQAAYESLFGRNIDAGNFRRRLRKMDYLIRLPEKDNRFSRKGAFYYRFDRELYEKAVADGHDFLLKP